MSCKKWSKGGGVWVHEGNKFFFEGQLMGKSDAGLLYDAEGNYIGRAYRNQLYNSNGVLLGSEGSDGKTYYMDWGVVATGSYCPELGVYIAHLIRGWN